MGERIRKVVEAVNGRPLAASVLSSVALGVLVGGCGSADTNSFSIAKQKANAQYSYRYHRRPPIVKFEMQYTGAPDRKVEINTGGDANTAFIFNSPCLTDSPWNPQAGAVAGIFSSGRVDGQASPSGAFVSTDTGLPDRLVVHPSNSQAPNLTLDGVVSSDHLTPANSLTAAALAPYGCRSGITGHIEH